MNQITKGLLCSSEGKYSDSSYSVNCRHTKKFEDSVTCGHVTCQQKKKKTIMEVSELSHINKPFSLFLSS